LGIIGLCFLPRDKPKSTPAHAKKLVLLRKEWRPAMVFGMAGALQGGVNCALAILAFHEPGIADGAMLVTASASTPVLLRYGAGRLVENSGPRKMAIPTAIAQAAGCLVAAQAYDNYGVIFAGILFGVAWAGITPVVLGLLFQESGEHDRGASMGAFHFSF